MSKLYKVKLLAHAGVNRRRAGMFFEKGAVSTVELTDEQAEAIKADSYFQITEADDVATEGSEVKQPTRKELNDRAEELGLDPKAYKNIEQITVAIEEAEAALENDSEDEGDDEEEDEDVVLADLSDDELAVIAEELGVEVEKTDDAEADRKALIDAIEAAKVQGE